MFWHAQEMARSKVVCRKWRGTIFIRKLLAGSDSIGLNYMINGNCDGEAGFGF